MALSDAERLRIQTHINFVFGIIKDSQAEYSKQLLSLSAAVLALSVAFLKNLVSLQLAVWFSLLYGAWALFLVTIFVTLIAIKVSIKANEIYREDLEDVLEGKTVLVGETWRDKWLSIFGWISTSAFAIGILLLVIFSVINIQKEKVMPNQTHATPTKDIGIVIDPQTDHVKVPPKDTHIGIGDDPHTNHVLPPRIRIPSTEPPTSTPPAEKTEKPAVTTPAKPDTTVPKPDAKVKIHPDAPCSAKTGHTMVG